MAASIRNTKARKLSLYSDAPEHHSVSIRKIDNGFVVSTSKSSGDKYDHKEEYHVSKPKIDIQSIPHIGTPSSKESVNSKALRQAAGTKKVKNT